MRFTIFSFLFLFALSLTAFAQNSDGVSAAGDVYGGSDSQAVEMNDEWAIYGEPMPDVMEKFTLSELSKQKDPVIGVEMQVTGTAGKMCGSDECFFMLEDGGSSAKVIRIDPASNMPEDLTGRKVTVFGMLEPIEDAGEPNDGMERQDAPKTYRIMMRSLKVYF
ncbi:hypothetical protein KQI65_14100 [bacterium]|nr:hypothetical protein [bacterium]